jgi:ABC-type antimicrobial peptide transport system permease subunit
VQLVLRQGAAWVLVGVALGAGGALALASALRAMVYGVNPLNPLSLLAGAVAVLVAAMLACWLPARRAAKVDPMVALRAE